MRTTPIIYVLDVGQGSCNVIDLGRKAPKDGKHPGRVGNRAIVIDCGPATPKVLPQLLAERGIDWIDCLILTHSDQDHVGGLPALVEHCRGRIAQVYYTFDRIDLMDLGVQLDEYAQKKWILNTPIQVTVNGSEEQLFPLPIYETPKSESELPRKVSRKSRVKLYALSPSGHGGTQDAKKPGKRNHVSMVCLLRIDESNLLFPGDSHVDNWRRIIEMRQYRSLAAKATVVPHHGGIVYNNQTDLDWLYKEAIKTDFGIISAGTINQPGHPNLDVLKALYAENIKVVCTEITPNCSGCTEREIGNQKHRKLRTLRPSFSSLNNNKVPCNGTIEFWINNNRIEFAPPTNKAMDSTWTAEQQKGCPLM
jgi:beta-lactamase superfamily II metal-dependent hydrolase